MSNGHSSEQEPTKREVNPIVGLSFPVPWFGWTIANEKGFHFVFFITEYRAEAWKKFEELMGDRDGDEWIGRMTFRKYWMSQGYRLHRVRCQIV